MAQAIVTYPVSCFVLSARTRKKIIATTSNYWWGGSADSRAIHWRRWRDLTVPKCHGGMGFRDIKQFNVAMLGKQGWQLMTNPESLCACVIKGKYYPTRYFLSARKKRNASHTWRAILTGTQALYCGLIKWIGNSESTNIWQEGGSREPLGVSQFVQNWVHQQFMLMNSCLRMVGIGMMGH